VAGRIPPHNLEAEISTLGALLLDQEAIMKVIDIIQPEDFYRTEHGTIYGAMQTLSEKRIPIDLVTVADELQRMNQLDEVGGLAKLSSLVSAVATATNVQHYAQIVRERAMLRRLISASAQIGDLAFQEGKDTQEVMDEAETALFGVTQRFLRQNFVSVRNILTESFERLDAISRNEGSMRGVPTGFKHVDSILGGLQRSDLIIVAARPSMGKCVAEGTLIVDPHSGALTPIEKLVKQKQGEVVTLGHDWQFGSETPSAFVYDGVKPTYEVVTALGRTIETTLVHPFLTITGWRRLEELKVGDRIGVPKKIAVFGEKIWPEYKVKLLAYFMANGALSRTTPSFTNVNAAIVADFVDSAEQFGPVRITRQESQGKRAPRYRISLDREKVRLSRRQWAQQLSVLWASRAPQLRQDIRLAGVGAPSVYPWLNGQAQPSRSMFEKIASYFPELPVPALFSRQHPVVEFLKEQGVWGKTAAYNPIPDGIFALTKPLVALFLNRLFSCHGTAYISRRKNGSGQPIIAYYSVSKTRIYQVQHLLLRFGITATVRQKEGTSKDSRRTAYALEIRGKEDILTFCDEIGIFGKEEAVGQVRASIPKNTKGRSKDTLPAEVWQRIIERKGTVSWREIYRQLDMPEYSNIHAHRRAPHRETVAKLARVLFDPELEAVSASDVFWDEIVSITPTGQKPVYDLTVPGSHNFLANDFIIHNTALCTNIAEHVAVVQKKTVGFFSLEMSKEQLVDRLISSIGMIDSWKLRNGKLNEEDYRSLNNAFGVLAETNLFIDDTPGMTVMEVRAKARRLQAEQGLDLVIIDYLQLMQGIHSTGDNRVQEVSEISRGLKALAKELNCPVIALSQLSRAVESRPDKRPLLSDLRESGSIEQDADVVMFLYREDYYNKDEQNNIMEILVRKHRNGPTGDAKVLARLQYSRFENLDTQRIQ
jgi:replicative DNA helicase